MSIYVVLPKQASVLTATAVAMTNAKMVMVLFACGAVYKDQIMLQLLTDLRFWVFNVLCTF